MDINIDDVERLLTQSYSRLLITGMSGSMTAVANAVEAGIAKNFIKQGRWAGGGEVTLLSGGDTRWVDLADSTKKQYEKKGWKQEPTLSRTGGGLAASIEVTPTSGLSIKISANKSYAAIHQFGGQAGRNLSVTIPARPFLILNKDTLEDIREEIIAAIQG